MHVDGLWRYPVKSLAGETLPLVAELTTDGLAGDRLVDGHRWDTPTALALVRDRAGAGAALAAYDGPERFDITNLLVATDAAVAHFGRRRAPAAPQPAARRGRAGRGSDLARTGPEDRQRTGLNLLRAPALHPHQHRPRQRCPGPRRLPAHPAGVRQSLALNSWVIEPGTVGIGDPVTLVETPATPSHFGGSIVGAPYAVD
jgi:hypothetical protein